MMKKGLFFVLLILTNLSWASEKPVRVYADVTGDLLHMGHVEFFKQAKAFGDILVIGVLSDEDVASYKRTPILTHKERVAMVRACRYVDEVIEHVPLRASVEWLKKHNIDLVVHGDDFNDSELLREQYGPAIDMGMFRFAKYTQGISTTEIIRRIQQRYTPNEPNTVSPTDKRRLSESSPSQSNL